MKKLSSVVILAVCLMTTVTASAQFGKLLDKVKGGGGSKKSGSFAVAWESEFDNKASRLAVAINDGEYVLGTDDNSATVLDASGQKIWSGDYKDITTNKTNKCEYQYIIHKGKGKGGYLFLFDARKMGTDRVAVIDIVSGKEMWNSEKYQNLISKNGDNSGSDDGELETVKYIFELDAFLISQKESVILVKANTGEKIWETNRFKGSVGKYIYDAKRNEIIMINFKPTALGALFAGFKNQLVKMNAVNGEILWDATFTGGIEKELVTKRAIVDLWIKGDKLFLYLNGLQVYSLNNGQKLWEAVYENDIEKSSGSSLLGNKSRKGYYRVMADPLFTEKSVYIVMLGGRDRTKYIEKHDLQSGKVLWTSEKITGAFCMPNIYLTGDKIMCQVGGKVEVQEWKLEKKASLYGGGETSEWVPYIYWDYKTQKNSVLAIDDKTGATSWRSEKFDKRITDFVLHENKTLFVGDGDQFYGYDIKSGNQLFDVKHNDAGVGKATDVIDFDDKVVVLSEKGLASYNKKDGSRAYATEKIRGVDFFYKIGENYFLRDQRNSKNILHGIDMTNGDLKGSVESKGKGGSPKYGNGLDVSEDGEFIYTFKGKKVEKIKINS
ncbi:MAG: PQQ-binding-like beta-propeller repeat protein [Bacteroidota bacterium]